jgi:toxin FitB
MIIIDTNVISELLRPIPEPAVEAWLGEQDGLSIYLTAISEAELRYGVADHVQWQTPRWPWRCD